MHNRAGSLHCDTFESTSPAADNEDPRHWGTSVQFIAVTGKDKRELTTFKGSGFLGVYLVELLLREEHDVIVLDSFMTSQPSDLDHLATHPRLRVIR